MLGQLMPDPTNTQALIVALNNVAAAGPGPSISMAGFNSASMTVAGTFTATVTFEGSIDGGLTFGPVLGTTGAGATGTNALASQGMWVLNPQWTLTHLRANVTAYTSGNVTVKCLTRVR